MSRLHGAETQIGARARLIASRGCGSDLDFIVPQVLTDGRGLNEMADARDPFWFVAAVFREPGDLVATIADLRASAFAQTPVVVLANHRVEEARKALAASESGRVTVVAVRDDCPAGSDPAAALPGDLRAFLKAMNGSGPGRGEGQAHVYAQLHQDVAEGALVLIAGVASPDAQLDGARILLRGKCECVLTHEIDGRQA